jgi:dienelactone hydrolase
MNSIQTKFTFSTFFLILVSLLLLSSCVAPVAVKEKGGTKALLDTQNDYTKELIKLDTRSGVTQNFLLFTPKKPIASVILFPGGNGRLSITDSGFIPNNISNLVVRIKEQLAQAGFTVALVDSPTDMQGQHGMYVNSFRCTDSHVQDISKVVEYLKGKNDIPVWLFGFSMGNHSATYLAGIFKDKIAGIIIASSITNWSVFNATAYKDYPDGIINLNLDQVVVPALIVHHEKDSCKGSPSSRVPEIKKALINSPKVEIKYITGGSSSPIYCGPLGYHGFKGKEEDAFNAITGFIKSNSK